MDKLRKTPLAEAHEKLGARMVDFAGWWMPVQYRGLREEHLAVRQHVGLFDVSHMGEIWVQGSEALAALQWLTTNDLSRLKSGQAQYSLLPNERGGLVDDIIVYCVEPGTNYLVCVNASNTDKDFAWMLQHNRGAEIRNESSQWAQIAVQGPSAMKLMERVMGKSYMRLESFHFEFANYQGMRIIVARTGYTGEDGCEIFLPNQVALTMWRDLLQNGAELGVEPIGLGARDTLRTEMKYSLYGHEIDDSTNPYAAALGWVVKPEAKDFLGKSAMLAQRERGLTRKLIGFKLLDKGIPRQGYSLFSFDNSEIGKVTSGTLSPSLNESIGIAYVDAKFAGEGSEFLVDIRGRKAKAKVVKTPFVKPQKN